MDLDTLWIVADRARTRPRLAAGDVSFVRDVAPDQLDAFPRLKLPASIRHPAGFPFPGRRSARSFAALCSSPDRKRWAGALAEPRSMSAWRRISRSASCARIFTTAIRRG